MSRTLQAALIFLAIMSGCYVAVCMANELLDLLWKAGQFFPRPVMV